MRNCKINFGYGLSPKWYSLKGAKIAAQTWFKKTGNNWLYVTEFKDGHIECTHLIERK